MEGSAHGPQSMGHVEQSSPPSHVMFPQVLHVPAWQSSPTGQRQSTVQLSQVSRPVHTMSPQQSPGQSSQLHVFSGPEQQPSPQIS
jgi:hypothetical protein